MKRFKKAAALFMILAFALAFALPASAKVDDKRTTFNKANKVINLGTGQPEVGLTVEDVSLSDTIKTGDISGEVGNTYTLEPVETWTDSNGNVLSPTDKFKEGKYRYTVTVTVNSTTSWGEPATIDLQYSNYKMYAPYVKWTSSQSQALNAHEIKLIGTVVLLKDKNSTLDLTNGSVLMDLDVNYEATIQTLFGADGIYDEYTEDNENNKTYTKIDLNYNGKNPVYDISLIVDWDAEMAQFDIIDGSDAPNIVKLVLSDAKKDEIYAGGDWCYDSLTIIFVHSVNDAKISSVKPQYYTGKAIKPAVKVTYLGKTLSKDNYTVSYKANKDVGTAKITVSGKGLYTGSKTISFDINPKGTKLGKLTAKKKAFTATWAVQKAKMSKKTIDGYQVQYALNSKFTKSAKKVNVKGYKTKALAIKKLKKKKVYFVRIRTYKKIGKKTYYSKWSGVKKVKTK